MLFPHHFFSCDIPRGIMIGILFFCCLAICSGPAFAQAITEYLTLQSQVQGGMQQGREQDQPANTGAQSVSSDGPDAWQALQDFLGGILVKISPLQVGIILVLLIFLWFRSQS